MQTYRSPSIRVLVLTFEHEEPAFTAASAGIAAVIAASNDEAAKRVAPLPISVNKVLNFDSLQLKIPLAIYLGHVGFSSWPESLRSSDLNSW